MRPTLSLPNTGKRLRPGDHIKVEFKNAARGESEWMWVLVEFDDEQSGIAFGRLDNVPALDHGPNLGLGSRVAVEYRNIRVFKASVTDSIGKYPGFFEARANAEPEKE